MDSRALTALLVVVVLAGGTYLFWQSRANDEPEPLDTVETSSEDLTFHEETDAYRVLAEYPSKPLPIGNEEANERALSAIESWLIGTIEEFTGLASSLDETEKEFMASMERKYELTIEYKSYSSGEYSSYEFD